jgi:RES domain-containing protein
MGPFLVGGRWNSTGVRVVYGSLSYACAMLEILVHLNSDHLPSTFVDVSLELPDSLPVETAVLPDAWREHPGLTADIGDEWVMSLRTVGLLVPSFVAKNEINVLINPAHPDFSKVVASAPSPVSWDGRLFS